MLGLRSLLLPHIKNIIQAKTESVSQFLGFGLVVLHAGVLQFNSNNLFGRLHAGCMVSAALGNQRNLWFAGQSEEARRIHWLGVQCRQRQVLLSKGHYFLDIRRIHDRGHHDCTAFETRGNDPGFNSD